MNYMDDDSENDSDYVPEDDVAEVVRDNKRRKGDSGEIIGMNSRRQRQVANLWDEIQNEDKEYIKGIMSKAMNNSLTSLEKPSKRMRRRAQIFMNRNFLLKSKKEQKLDEIMESESNRKEDIALRTKLMQTVAGLARKTTVTERRKFAGQEIIVQATVTKKNGTNEETAKPASSIDQALNLIKGPKAINTVSKSSMDWENYKEKEGLQDDLAHSKEHYLERKEFLDRCDYRSFEQERDERLAKQAQRGTA